MKRYVRLYKDGDNMPIETNCRDEAEFLGHIAGAFESLIDAGTFTGDWQFQFDGWLRNVVEIACKYRGYKSSVEQETVLVSGSSLFQPSAWKPVVDTADSDQPAHTARVETS